VDDSKFGDVDFHAADDKDRVGAVLGAGDVQSKYHHGWLKGEVLQPPVIQPVLSVNCSDHFLFLGKGDLSFLRMG